MASNLPDTAQQAAEVQRDLRTVRRAQRWMRHARIALGLALLVLAVYAWLSYRVFTVPGLHDPAARTHQFPIQGIRSGDSLILQNLNLWREPRLGDVVIYQSPQLAESVPETLIGRVVGLPGERLARLGPTMAIGGREPLSIGFDLGSDVPVRDGDMIPDGRYLIVCDDDSVPYPDSRTFGYVAREGILRRVVMNFSSGFGRSANAP